MSWLTCDVIFVGVDVGSVRRPGGFSWAAVDDTGAKVCAGRDDPSELANQLVHHLAAREQVAVAFEAPMSVPVPHDWHDLARARGGEGRRPWSAGAGTGALATGLVQAAWICRHIAQQLPETRATTQVARFQARQAQLLLAEALVSDDGKPEPVGQTQDDADAIAAAMRLAELMGAAADIAESDVWCKPAAAFNLAAMIATYAGLVINSDEFHDDVLVAKARPVT